MAVMNGPEMVAKIRESIPSMKVLFMPRVRLSRLSRSIREPRSTLCPRWLLLSQKSERPGTMPGLRSFADRSELERVANADLRLPREAAAAAQAVQHQEGRRQALVGHVVGRRVVEVGPVGEVE